MKKILSLLCAAMLASSVSAALTQDQWDGRIVMLKCNVANGSTTSSFYLRNARNAAGNMALQVVPEATAKTSFESTDSAYCFYWVIGKAPTDSTYYYFSSYHGDGYLGFGEGYDWAISQTTKSSIAMVEDYKEEFHILGFDKSGGTSGATMNGYALQFYLNNSGNSGTRWIAVSNAGGLNWFNRTTGGSTTGYTSDVVWSTDFELVDVTAITDATQETTGTLAAPTEYGWKTTFVRSDDSYTNKDGEDYNYYATIRLPFAVALPQGVTAYTCTTVPSEDNTVVGLKELTGLSVNENNEQILPRESAVLLMLKHEDGDTDVKKTLYLRPQNAQTFITDTNDFNGTLGQKTYTDYDASSTTNRYYVLSKKNGRVAFYHLGSQTVNHNKAFYIYNGSSNAAALSFCFMTDEDDTTGVLPIVAPAEDNDAPVYDLMGRRVQNPTQKGIYIRGGKKILVK